MDDQKKMTAMQSLRPVLTKRQYAEVLKALRETDRPFLSALSKIYARAPWSGVVHADGRIETVDIYERLPQELRNGVDDINKVRREMQESVLRSYGIEPGIAPEIRDDISYSYTTIVRAAASIGEKEQS